MGLAFGLCMLLRPYRNENQNNPQDQYNPQDLGNSPTDRQRENREAKASRTHLGTLFQISNDRPSGPGGKTMDCPKMYYWNITRVYYECINLIQREILFNKWSIIDTLFVSSLILRRKDYIFLWYLLPIHLEDQWHMVEFIRCLLARIYHLSYEWQQGYVCTIIWRM